MVKKDETDLGSQCPDSPMMARAVSALRWWWYRVDILDAARRVAPIWQSRWSRVLYALWVD